MMEGFTQKEHNKLTGLNVNVQRIVKKFFLIRKKKYWTIAMYQYDHKKLFLFLNESKRDFMRNNFMLHFIIDRLVADNS
jgi:Zn-dependent peptidase ImmA (M78 family)